MVARANKKVSRENKGKSKLRFHSTPEGGVIIPLESGYVYVSNAKVEGGKKTQRDTTRQYYSS